MPHPFDNETHLATLKRLTRFYPLLTKSFFCCLSKTGPKRDSFEIRVVLCHINHVTNEASESF